ncbi:MAG: XRE family transcriptional regulator [Acidobacteriia bacterium]|nr:XRE family transcriptional regulator [Terriglobia bacterium]
MEHHTQNEAVILGERIREARERLKWTQIKLAMEVGLGSAQTISTIESGNREVKASELTRIARALHTSIDNLLNPELRPEPKFAWREQPQEGFEEHESRFMVKCERYGLLEKWCNASNPQPLPSLRFRSPCPSFGDAQRQADNVRNTLQLGGRPACSLEKALEEDYGVKVFYDDLGADGGAAFSLKSWFGTAVLLNSCHAPWRRNFSLAHEFFHLLTMNQLDTCDRDLVEKLANVFASALLLPSEHLLAAFEAGLENGKISYESLVEMAREFGVSIDALLWRLVNLGRLQHDIVKDALASNRLRAIDRASVPSWDPAPRLPERFVRLCFLAYRQGKIGLAKLAEFLETSIVDLAEQVYETGAEAADGEQTKITVAGC